MSGRRVPSSCVTCYKYKSFGKNADAKRGRRCGSWIISLGGKSSRPFNRSERGTDDKRVKSHFFGERYISTVSKVFFRPCLLVSFSRLLSKHLFLASIISSPANYVKDRAMECNNTIQSIKLKTSSTGVIRKIAVLIGTASELQRESLNDAMS